MKKVIFGIFAHPDDEAFGPAGTLIQEVQNGSEVHLITLTAGQAGSNPDNHEDLGVIRLEEWKKSGELIGASSMTHLGYKDSSLCNSSMIDIAEKIESLVRQTIDQSHPDQVEFVSFELGGISGHIDHIVAARATCLVFYRMKPHEQRLHRIRLFCLPQSWAPAPNVGWVFMDVGYPEESIEKIDVSATLDTRVAVIKAHHTQRNDGSMHLERLNDPKNLPHYDHFIVRR
ncbi:MAG: PIG-L family deacetylase [Candidatus Saccharimonadales bacterium]